MKMPVGLTVRPKIDLACPLGRHPLQRSVETRPALGLDLARQRIGDVARAARSEFESGEILGAPAQPFAHIAAIEDRKSVAEGKSVSVSVDLGGRRIIQKKKTTSIQMNLTQE